MNRDFAEMLKLLAAENVEYLVVGGYAVAGHGVPRATGRPQDLADIARLQDVDR